MSRPGAPAGSRAVILQLCLALADLALQMPEWTNVVQSWIDRYGQDPATVVLLLRFLSALAEESLNPRLPAPPPGSDVYDVLVTGSAEQVIGVLSMYIQAPGGFKFDPV